MKKRFSLIGFLAFILSFVFGASMVAAQVGTNADLSVSAHAEAMEMEAGADMDADVMLEMEANEAMENEMEESEDGEMMELMDDVNGEESLEVSAELPLLNISVKSKGAAGMATEVTGSTQVKNETDLGMYAETVVATNENVSEIEVENSAVHVTVKEKARLFGFIPVSLKAKTEVMLESAEDNHVEAKVKVRYPWWGIFAKRDTPAADFETALTEKINAVLTTQASVDASVYARVIEAVSAHFTMEQEVEVETTTETEVAN
ncbi:hypothetical protein L0Y41_03425 [bacterium]|nr:hypothetical protein [bacterium]